MTKIRKCLLPAAGYDPRFLPATKAIIAGRRMHTIENRFDVSYELEHQIVGTDKESLESNNSQI
jgi:UTP--glucose-1-phosphate uridylyltransferase